MRKHPSLSVGVAAALLMVVAIAATATAAGRTRPFRSSRAEGYLRSQPFTLAGEFSGTLSGEIVLNGLPYRLSPNAFVYEIGRGVVPVGTEVRDRFVTVSGLTTNRVTVVYSIIIRPEGEATFQSDDMSSKVKIQVPNTPK